MAQITRANGTAQPVFALDVANGSIAGSTSTAATPVQPQGPKLDFFQVTCANTNATLQGVNGYVSNVIQSIQQTATVAMYQVDGAQISFAVYPTGAFVDAAAFLTAARVANVAGVNGAASATGVGFKLATS
jgi:hypothetical protein